MSTELFSVITDFRIPKKDPAMRHLIILCCLGSAKLTASQDLRLLDAIAQVESGNNHWALNKASGTRGAWQITESTWKQHTSWPFADAYSPTKAQAVALMHLRWLRQELEKDPQIGEGNVTNHHLSSAWLRGVNYRKSDERERLWLERLDYCARVKNLMEATP